ncbi:eukaryotic porin/Tom40 [Delphinella strobiligena]|nr:eukaryotic porin/Tom40 [Delphinella strobiligena]
MAIPDFSDISIKPSAGAPFVATPASLPIPAFSDISKAANDLINKDFYHTQAGIVANLEVKLKAPNGANVNVKGKQSFDGATAGSIEGKYTLKPQGMRQSNFIQFNRLFLAIPVSTRQSLFLMLMSAPVQPFAIAEEENESPSRRHYLQQWSHNIYLAYNFAPGITVTQGWTTQAILDTKVEFASLLSQPVKAEFQNLFSPNNPSKAAQKLNLTFKQPNVHARAFLDHSASGNINALIDAAVGHEGFIVGAEAGYDVSKAAITRYSAGAGYQHPTFTASVLAQQNLSVIAASYYQKVNSNVEAGAKATYDLQGGKNVALEVASKYKLDPVSFAKAKINDRGIAALAYNTKLNRGTTLGLGLSLDTAKLNEAGHKIGTSLTFEG